MTKETFGMRKMRNMFVTILAIGAVISPLALAADKESKTADRLDASADVIRDMMHASDKGVPQDLMNKAHCVVIVPNMKRAGFIFGAKYGRGFSMCRRPGGAGWSAPAAMRIEGGSFGLQIGGTENDLVLLVMNDQGMKHLLEDKFTLGTEATAAAGPVGRDATAQTDAQLHAEMLSYSRARGIFGGLSLEGATLRPDQEANRELYGKDMSSRAILASEVKTPPAADKLRHVIDGESNQRK
jgi:lipid-binding SYLF domain-containing protein